MSETLVSDQYHNAEIGRLNRESAARRVKLRELKQSNEKFQRRIAELEAELEIAIDERDTIAQGYEELEQQFNAAPDELRSEVERLQNEIRTRDHRAAFDRIAAESHVRPDAIEDIYRLSGYTPDSDVPDPEAIKSLIDDQVSRKPYLLQQEQTPVDPAQLGRRPSTARVEPPSLGRGVPADRMSAGLGFTKAQLKDVEFMRLNQGRIAEMSKNGSFVIED